MNGTYYMFNSCSLCLLSGTPALIHRTGTAQGGEVFFSLVKSQREQWYYTGQSVTAPVLVQVMYEPMNCQKYLYCHIHPMKQNSLSILLPLPLSWFNLRWQLSTSGASCKACPPLVQVSPATVIP